MKVTEQYFHEVLFIMLYKVVLLLSLWMKSSSVTIQMKALVQYVPVVLFIVKHKVVSTLKSVDKILKCDHPKQSCITNRFHFAVRLYPDNAAWCTDDASPPKRGKNKEASY